MTQCEFESQSVQQNPAYERASKRTELTWQNYPETALQSGHGGFPQGSPISSHTQSQELVGLNCP